MEFLLLQGIQDHPLPPQYKINLALGALSAKLSSQEVTLTSHLYLLPTLYVELYLFLPTP
jgi:hypothetical protein